MRSIKRHVQLGRLWNFLGKGIILLPNWLMADNLASCYLERSRNKQRYRRVRPLYIS